MAADAGAAWPAMSIEDANRMLAQPGTPLAVGEGVINGISMKYYPEAPPSIRFLVEASAMHGERDFIVYEDERATFLAHLKADGIGCAIYYPIPLHLQDCFASLGYQRGQLPVAEQACEEVLALPIFPELSETAQLRVMASIASFYGSN